jgi:outer membrane protein insertion porin family
MPAWAQDPLISLIGRPIASVTLDITGRPDAPQDLLTRIDLKAGDMFTIEAERSSVRKLVSLGPFDAVEVSVNDSPAGIAIVFKATPRYPITRVVFTGTTGLPAKDLERGLRERYGGLPTNTPLATVEDTIESLLADEGYPNARATVTTQAEPTLDRASLMVDVDAGTRATISELILKNQSPWSDAEILSKAGVVRGGPYRIGDLETRLDSIQDTLRKQGHYRALATREDEETPDGWRVTIAVSAGPKVFLRWAIDSDKPAVGNIKDLVPVELQHAVDNDLLEDAKRRIENRLHDEGYLDGVAPFSTAVLSGDLVIEYKVTKGPRYYVDHVTLPPNLHIATPIAQAALAVVPGAPLNGAKLDAGRRNLTIEYWRQGYYAVQIEPARLEPIDRVAAAGQRWVIVHLDINEGPKGVIGEIKFSRDTTQVPEAALRQLMQSASGKPYVQGFVLADRQLLDTYYRDHGFRSASVEIVPDLKTNPNEIPLTVKIFEGPQITVQDIQVVGNVHVSDQSILDEIKLRPNAPYGEADRLESQRRLSLLGVFRRVGIATQPLLPGETHATVVVTVEELPASNVGWGAGVEAGNFPRSAVGGGTEDHLVISPRGFFQIGRRNLWGRNRGIDFFSRLALKPTSAPGDPIHDGRGYGFSEYRVSLTYRERRAFHTDTDLLLSISSEQGLRDTFNFLKRSMRAEGLRRYTQRVTFTGRYGLEFTRRFDERFDSSADPTNPNAVPPTIDRLFPQVRLSLLGGGVIWDNRNNTLEPTRGTMTTADLEVSSTKIGSEVGYIKTFLEASAYRQVDREGKYVAAGRAQLGLAHAAESTVVNDDGTVTIAEILPASQRFFAGGANSVRGFVADRLGVPEILTADGLSRGGNGVVVFNAEMRVLVAKPGGKALRAVGFFDTGNVFAKASDIEFGRLRNTAGFGARYDSALGPVRLDFGFKLDRQFIGGKRERGWEYHLSFGEVF